LNIEKLRKVQDYYNGSSNLPEKQYLSNALENQFQLPPEEHDEFTEVFKANCKYLGIEDGLKTRHTRVDSGDLKSIDVRSMGKPKGDFQRTAFVIMPFSEKGKQERPKGFFDEVLKSVITPAANAAGFAVETARQEDSDVIHHTIINRLLHDDLVIADLTDHNPNVLFELGIRLAKEKAVVLIKSKDTGPIFDVDNMLRVYIYDQNLWKSTVEADVKGLSERISGTWENTETTVGYMRILTTGPHAVRVP
jgi:nucleoside 2-deoxyribosyltransferase